MGKFIDFAALRERLPIEEVADMLPVKWETKGEQLRTTCPVHGGTRGLVITPSKGLFICQASHEAKKGGDSIALCAHVMQTSNYEAAEYLAQQIGMDERNSKPVTVTSNSYSSKSHATVPQEQKPQGRTEKSQPARAPFDPNEYLSKLTYSEEIEALGISEADARRWVSASSTRGYTVDGLLLPFVGRAEKLPDSAAWKAER